MTTCEPITTVAHLDEYQKTNLKGVKMDDNEPASPCGFLAKTFFNDKFQIKHIKVGDDGEEEESEENENGKEEDSKVHEISIETPSHSADVMEGYKNYQPNDDLQSKQWIDITDCKYSLKIRHF